MESGGSGSDRVKKLRRLADCFEAGALKEAESLAREMVAADRHDQQARYLLAQIVFKQKSRDRGKKPSN